MTTPTHSDLCKCGHSYYDHHFRGDGSPWEPCSKCKCPHLRLHGSPVPQMLIDEEKTKALDKWVKIFANGGIIMPTGTDVHIISGDVIKLTQDYRDYEVESYLEVWNPMGTILYQKIKLIEY